MQKTGGVLGIISGIFGFLAAIFTLLIGGIGGALEAEDANTVIGLGWGGILFSFMCIIFGALALSAQSRTPGIFLLLSSALGAILGGTFVAVTMLLAFVGGILALFVKKPLADKGS